MGSRVHGLTLVIMEGIGGLFCKSIGAQKRADRKSVV